MNTDAFQGAFIVEAIEGNGCYCGGSFSDDKIDVIVELGKVPEDPEDKFARVTAWLDTRSDIEGRGDTKRGITGCQRKRK
jgi:uncharacterized protein YggL (DUF469 family)